MTTYTMTMHYGSNAVTATFSAETPSTAKSVHESVRSLAPSGVQITTYSPSGRRIRENRATGPNKSGQFMEAPFTSPQAAASDLHDWIGSSLNGQAAAAL